MTIKKLNKPINKQNQRPNKRLTNMRTKNSIYNSESQIQQTQTYQQQQSSNNHQQQKYQTYNQNSQQYEQNQAQYQIQSDQIQIQIPKIKKHINNKKQTKTRKRNKVDYQHQQLDSNQNQQYEQWTEEHQIEQESFRDEEDKDDKQEEEYDEEDDRKARKSKTKTKRKQKVNVNNYQTNIIKNSKKNQKNNNNKITITIPKNNHKPASKPSSYPQKNIPLPFTNQINNNSTNNRFSAFDINNIINFPTKLSAKNNFLSSNNIMNQKIEQIKNIYEGAYQQDQDAVLFEKFAQCQGLFQGNMLGGQYQNDEGYDYGQDRGNQNQNYNQNQYQQQHEQQNQQMQANYQQNAIYNNNLNKGQYYDNINNKNIKINNSQKQYTKKIQIPLINQIKNKIINQTKNNKDPKQIKQKTLKLSKSSQGLSENNLLNSTSNVQKIQAKIQFINQEQSQLNDNQNYQSEYDNKSSTYKSSTVVPDTKYYGANNMINKKLSKIKKINQKYFQLDLTNKLAIYKSNPQIFQNQSKKIHNDFVKIQDGNEQREENIVKYQDGYFNQDCSKLINKLFKDQLIDSLNNKLIFKQKQLQKMTRHQIFQRDMALVFSTGGYGINYARTFFGPNINHTDYHNIMKRLISKIFKFIQQYFFYNRIKIKIIQPYYFKLLKEYISDFKQFLTPKSQTIYKKFIRMAFKVSTGETMPSTQDAVMFYKQIMELLNSKLMQLGKQKKEKKKICQSSITDAAKKNLWTDQMQDQLCRHFLQTSIQSKNLTVIRNKLLMNHPDLNQREFNQDFIRLKFRNLLRKLIIKVVMKRIQLLSLKKSYQSGSVMLGQKQKQNLKFLDQIPRIKKIDQNKIRIIVNGFDGIQARISLIKFNLDPNNIQILANTIQEMNYIQAPGVQYQFMDDQYLIQEYQNQKKRGRRPRNKEMITNNENNNENNNVKVQENILRDQDNLEEFGQLSLKGSRNYHNQKQNNQKLKQSYFTLNKSQNKSKSNKIKQQKNRQKDDQEQNENENQQKQNQSMQLQFSQEGQMSIYDQQQEQNFDSQMINF